MVCLLISISAFYCESKNVKNLAKQGLDRSKIHVTIDVDSKDANKGKYVDLSKGKIENVRIESDEDEDEDEQDKGAIGFDKGTKGKFRKKEQKPKDRKSKDVSRKEKTGKGRKKMSKNKGRKKIKGKKHNRNKTDKETAKMAKRKGKQRKEKKQRKENKRRKASKGKRKAKQRKEKKQRKENKKRKASKGKIKRKKKSRKLKKTGFLPNPEGSPNPDGLKIPLTFHREEIHENKTGSSLNKEGVDGQNTEMDVADIKDDNSKGNSLRPDKTSSDIDAGSNKVDSSSNVLNKDSNKVDNNLNALDNSSHEINSPNENGLKSNEPDSKSKQTDPNDALNAGSLVNAQPNHKLRDITKEIIITALKEVHSMSQKNATAQKSVSMSSPLEVKMVGISV